MGYGFGGGFGGGNMQALMRQAQKMQEDMKRIREEIDNTEYTSTVGGGMVEVCILGNKTMKRVKIKPEVVDPDDVEMLEDLIVAAINEAMEKVDEESASAMSKLTGGKGGGMPGLF